MGTSSAGPTLAWLAVVAAIVNLGCEQRPLGPTTTEPPSSGTPGASAVCPAGVSGSIELAPLGDPDKALAHLSVPSVAWTSDALIDFTSYLDGREYDWKRAPLKDLSPSALTGWYVDVVSRQPDAVLRCGSVVLAHVQSPNSRTSSLKSRANEHAAIEQPHNPGG
jgi:hypothetical protein